jgi:hypothetical protein
LQNRKLVITLAGVLAVVFIFVSSNVAANHEPRPHDLSLGVVGGPQLVSATARQLDRRAPGAFHILGYPSPAAARTAILVVGAFTSQFLAIRGVAALFVLALALPIAFFQRLLGLPGTGVGLESVTAVPPGCENAAQGKPTIGW